MGYTFYITKTGTGTQELYLYFDWKDQCLSLFHTEQLLLSLSLFFLGDLFL